MARQFSAKFSEDITNSDCSSPEGFWPIPYREAFDLLKSTPWTVPRKRTSRKKKEKDLYFYDPTEEELCISRGGEVTTMNRFSVLDTSHSEIHHEVLPDLPDSPDSPINHDRGDILHDSYEDFMFNNYISFNPVSYKFTSYRMYVYVGMGSTRSILHFFVEFMPKKVYHVENSYSKDVLKAF